MSEKFSFCEAYEDLKHMLVECDLPKKGVVKMERLNGAPELMFSGFLSTDTTGGECFKGGRTMCVGFENMGLQKLCSLEQHYAQFCTSGKSSFVLLDWVEECKPTGCQRHVEKH